MTATKPTHSFALSSASPTALRTFPVAAWLGRQGAALTFLIAALALLPPVGADAQTRDDPYLGLDSPSVQEGDSGATTLTFTARLTDANGRTKAGAKTITAHYEVLSEPGDTATAGRDYRAASGTLTFAPGETSKTIEVNVLGDTEVEEDETLTVKWRGWKNVWLVEYAHTGTIRDDDSASVPVIPATLSIADASAQEGDILSFTVTLDKAVTGGLTVTPSFTDGTATQGADYTAKASALGFRGTAGETQSFTVSTMEDEDVEGDETFTVGLSVSGTEHEVTAIDTATGTIANDDEKSAGSDDRPYLGLDSPSVQEGDSGTTTLTFTARLTDANGRTQTGTKTITANYQVLSESGDAATAGKDYRAASGTLTFAPGETSKTIDVSVMGDTEVEGDETLTVKWTGWENVLLASYSAIGTIANDDQERAVSATLAIADASADEGNALSFSVTLDEAVPGGLTATPTFTDGVTVPGEDYSHLTATQGRDYTASRLTLDFAGTAGETVTFTVPTIEDWQAEYPEVFTVGLSVSGTSHRVTATDTATGIIYDDDAVAGAFAASSDRIKDNGSSITIYSPKDPVLGRMEYQCTIPKRVTETADTSLRFKYFQIACGARPGAIRAGAVAEFWSSGSATATNGSSGDWDYDFFNRQTKFWPGDKSIQHLGFRVNDDELTEGPEYFQFSLKWTTKVGLGWLGIWLTLNESVDTVTVWIDDDDEYNLSVAPASVTEAGGAKAVTVTAAVADGAVLAEARTLGIQVGKNGDLAVEGTDYQNVGNFDVTIPKGSNTGTGAFTLTPVVDAHLEPNERITVAGNIKSAINGRTLSARVNGTALWLNDSSVVTLAAAPPVNEGGGAQTVTVTATATGTAQRDTPVTVSVGKSGDAAAEGADYQAVSDFTITIPSGSKSGTGTFRITPINDTDVEDDETITLSGSIPGGTVTDGSLALLDNDLTLSLSPASTGEEAGAKSVTVTARAKTARDAARTLTVSVGKVGDSAEEGTDYGTVADFSLTIPANQASGTATFTFTPRDDTIIEGMETVTVGGTGTGLDVGRATLSITETDTTDFVITLNPNPVAEGVNWRNLVVTVSTTDGYTVSKNVNCQFQNGGGSATWGSDYYIAYSNKGIKPPGTPGTSIIPTLTINAGQTSGSRTVRLKTIGDNTVEGDETVQIKGYSLYPHVYKSCTSSDNPRTVDSDPYPADLTIVDDETSISLSASPSSVAEDAGDTSVTVTASMKNNAPAAMPVTVRFGNSLDSATSGTDYVAVDAFKITIPQGSKSATKTITFTPRDDTLAEDDETITLTGKTPKTSVSSTQLTIDDDDDTGITLAASPASVSEGGGAKTVTVTAKTDGTTFPAARHVNVQVGKTGDGATEGTDYKTVADFTLTIPFAKTQGTGAFTLTPVDDSTLESNESISIDGTTSASDTVTGTSVTLADDDASITLAASPSSVTENGGARTVTVTATAASAVEADTALTIAVGQSGDSAVEGSDYSTVADFTLTIRKDATAGTGTFTLTPVDDALYEGASESLTVSGSATEVRVGTASVAITDDDPETEVSLSLKPTRVKECGADTEVWVTAKLPDSADAVAEDRKITVSVGKSGDGAVSGTDYTAVKDFDLTIPAGHRSGLASFELKPVDDHDVEGDETLTVHGTAKRLKVKNEPQMTLVDDDQPVVILTMDPATIPENDTETSVKVKASLFTGDFCGKTHDVAGSGAAMASVAAGMVGASAAEVAEAVLGPGAHAVSANSARTVTVSVGDTSDTATSGTDYTAVSSFTVTIPAGKSSGTATFTTTASLDNLLEPSETLTVKGASTGTTVTPAGGYVANKDQVDATLTVSPSSLSESAGDTTVTVTVNTGGVTSAARYEVPIRVSGGTATAGTDFAKVKDFDLVLAANATSGTGTFTLSPTDDTLVEGDETLNVIVPNTELSKAVTLNDDDDGTITLSVSPTSVPENAGDESVTVTAATGGATFPADRTVTVTVGDSSDGATSGTDYAAVSSFDITITAGQTSGSGTFTLTPRQDTVVEGDETISVDGTSTGVTVNGASVTLTDDDSTGITLRLSPSSVSEKDEATTVTVTAVTDGDTFSKDRTVTVSVGKNTDSATSGTDYAAVADLDITITAGDTSASGTFTLTPKQDTLVEGNETISVEGTSTGLTVNGVSATITDDDAAPEVNLTTNPSSVSEGAAATSVTVTATFSSSSTYPVAKTVSVTVGDSGDSATSGADYAAVTGFDITISAGQSSGSASFTLTPKDDTLVEGGEMISVDGDSTGLAVNAANLTLADDDDSPAVNLSANPSSVSEGAAATSVTVTAQFSNTNTYAADKTVTVTVGDTGDGATSGTDYSTVADFDIVIKAGDTSATGNFTLTPKDDTLVEGNESLSVDGAATGMTVNGGSVTLTDDDGAPAINLSVNPSSVSEGAAATSVTVTASFSNTSTYATAKAVSVTVGDSSDSAVSGTDYAAVTPFDVTIAAGDSSGSATFTLTPTDDTVVEGNETLSLSGTSDLTVNGASMTLTDDDGAPAINLSTNPSSVSEGAAATLVTVTASFSNSNTYPRAKTVSVTVGDSADSAVSGTDYAAVTAFDVTISAGDSSGSATFTLTPTQDRSIEGNETISLSGTSDLTVNDTSMTLTDDDSTELSLSVEPSSVEEDDSATKVIVTAETDGDTFTTDRTVRIKVGSASDSATSGKDYSAVTPFDVTIKGGDTSATANFTLTLTDDNVIEGEEAISVSGASTGLTVNAASVTIGDNDEPKIILDIKPFLETDPDKLPESAGATRVTVTAGTTGGVFALDRQIHVTVGKSGDTAVFGTDYDTPSVAFHVLIKAGDTEGEKTFTLTPADDVIVEGDESLTLQGSAAGLEVTTATITIKDNDVPDMSISATPLTLAEDVGATEITMTVETGGVTFPADRTVRVTVGDSGDSATSETDYAPVDAFDIPITAGQKSATGTFTLTPVDDSIVEGNESITLSSAAAGLTMADIVVTVTDNDGAPSINLAAAPSQVAEYAGATAVTVTASFSNSSTYESDTPVTVSVGGTGTATSGTDYAAVADLEVTIAKGATSGTGTFTLTPTQDSKVEGSETIGVDGSAAGLTVKGAAMRLTDDDGAPSVDLSVNPASVGEGDGATQVTVTAAFSNSSTYAVDKTVTVTVGGSGTATSGTDYPAVADLEVTIAKGATSGTGAFTLTPTQDSEVEGSETIGVDGSAAGLTVKGAALRLTDDDGAPSVNLSLNPASVGEDDGATPVTVTAAFSNSSTYAVDKTVTVTVGGSGTATSGEDYEAVPDFTLTIEAGRSSGTETFTLTPIQDTVAEEDETIGVAGSAAGLTVNGAKLTLTPMNTPPVAVDDEIEVQRGRSVSAVMRGATHEEATPVGRELQDSDAVYSVLDNDSDLEDERDELKAELVAAPQHGQLELSADGTFTYTHDGRGSSEDQFVYRAYDSEGASSNEATAHIRVAPANAGPVAVGTIPDQTLLLGAEGSVEIEEYFSDPDGDALSYEASSLDAAIVTASLSGVQVGLTPVSVALTRVTVTASDPEGLSAEQSFGVTVIALEEEEARMVDLSLAALGRTIASQAVDAIGSRLEQGGSGSQASLGGQQFNLGSGEAGDVQVAGWVQGLARMLGRGRQFLVPARTGDARTAAGLPAPGQTGANRWWAQARPGVSLDGDLPFAGSGSGFGGGSFGGGTPGPSQDPMTGGAARSGFSGRDMMSHGSFQFSPDRKGSREQGSGEPGREQRWTVWGQGAGSQFSGGSHGDYGLDGRVGAAYLGADHRWGSKAVLGLAASRSQGALDYQRVGGRPGGLDATLTSVHPYAQWSPRPGVSLWGLMGFGRGTAELSIGDDLMDTDLGIWMGALGGRSQLARLGSVDVALKADAFAASVGSEAVQYVRSGRGEAQRMRLMVDAGTRWAVSPNVQMAPSLEMGIRMDGGDAETGLGAELAGGVTLANQRLGLEVEARGHWLVAHQDRRFRERGLSLAVSLDPGSDGKGWRFLMRPLWGRQSSGPEALWQNHALPAADPGRDGQWSWNPDRTQADLSYEMRTWGDRGRLGPFARLEAEPQRGARLGGGLQLEIAGSPEGPTRESRSAGLRLELFGDHRRVRQGAGSGLPPAQAGNPDHRLGASLTLTFWRWDSEWTEEIPAGLWGRSWPQE